MYLSPLAQSTVHSQGAGGTVEGDVRTSVSAQSPFPGGTSQLTSNILSSFPSITYFFFFPSSNITLISFPCIPPPPKCPKSVLRK